MTFNIHTPKKSKQPVRFKPGLLLWLFTGCFLPLFITLGFWQLNRADEKSQLLTLAEGKPLTIDEIEWSNPPLYRDVMISGEFVNPVLFLLDNKTYNGQFGYEVWRLMDIDSGSLMVSLGWVAGSYDRAQLPSITLPESLDMALFTMRPAPENPLFGVGANVAHGSDKTTWVVQSLTAPWVVSKTKDGVLGFAQLLEAEHYGVGPNVWQPSVMTPAKHLGYAFQWFAMATALLIMFLYAGLKQK